LRKDFHIVLSFDTPNTELHETFKELAKSAGRDLHTAANLAYGSVNDGGGKPSLTLYSDDFLMGKEEFTAEEDKE
jgi:hypothetical protein